MAKQTLKDKEKYNKKVLRYEKGYKDFWLLLGIVAIVWLLEAPAAVGLIISESRPHFHFYGAFMIIASVLGYLLSVLLLALDKRKASITLSVVCGVILLLICALIYIGYERAINTSGFNWTQIIVSYVIPAISVPIADIIMVKRRL